MFFRKLFLAAWSALAVVGLSVPVSSAAEGDGKQVPLTTEDPTRPTAELALLLTPLSKDELLIEAEAWRGIVRAKAEEIARAEIAVRRQNVEIKKAAEISQKTQEARKKLEEVSDRIGEARQSGDSTKMAEAREVASSARESIREVHEVVEQAVEAVKKSAEVERELSVEDKQHLDEMVSAAEQAKAAVGEVKATLETGAGASGGEVAVADKAAEQAEQAKEATDKMQESLSHSVEGVVEATEKAAALDQAVAVVEKAGEIRKQEKIGLLETVTRLREQRTLLLDNMRAVVDELETKTDQADSDTRARIKDYRLYLAAVSGIHVDVTDTTSAWVSVKGWVISDEGGKRWLINLGTFAGILVAAWFVAKLLSRAMQKATGRLSLPALLADFLVRAIRWLVMIVGTIWALTALEVSIAPLLALFGAASFIIAFAMQDSLSNFASGLMILFFRPFDMGDVVDAGGVSGKVSSVNLVSTTIRTFDNKMMVVPNSKIWSDVITNATGVTERRVDMEFGISYSDDIDKAQQVLEEIVASHSKVLREPPAVIKLSALADSSVNFICRPWARPADYWDVYWDVTREVKRRFDAEGIGIPFPQRDVHLYVEQGEPGLPLTAHPAKPREKPPESGGTKTGVVDGGLDT